LHQDIKPLVLEGPPTNNSQNQFFIKFMAVKVAPGQVSDVIAFIENEWNSTVTDRAFEYSFLDESLNRQYQAEVKFGGVSLVFTLLAIFVACLGLFGLATFTAQQRTKEIGIRKVLGASVSSITLLLSVDFLRLVLLSVVIASPVAYYAMYRWLESFAYRIAIPWWVFLAAGIVALTVAIVTISYQSIKAALSNPVKSLRNE
jgi:putative ABC transport system permease protein